MARKATIVGTVLDMFGRSWDVRERRPTGYGWDVLIGWPQGEPRGRGCRGVRVITTNPLGEYLAATRKRDIRLPISRNTVARLRRELGLHWRREREQWWHDKADELLAATVREFAARYNLTESRVSIMRQKMFGRTLRVAGWWRCGEAAELLVGPTPTRDVAKYLDISTTFARNLRRRLRSSQ